MNNPLQKYFRQPKIYISLPSKGLFYPEGTIDGDPNNVPILAMTGIDEIIMKTPDALFNGESTIKLIESCCPYIKNAKNVPSLDIDTILAAIRIATFGEDISISHVCKSCETENDYDIPIQSIIDHYSNKMFDSRMQYDDLVINFRPLSFQEMTTFNVENFNLQQQLKQLPSITNENIQMHMDLIYEKLADIQIKIFLSSISSIQTPDGEVTDKNYIKEWLSNCSREIYQEIKKKLEINKNTWATPTNEVKCINCGSVEKIEISLEQSHFFV